MEGVIMSKQEKPNTPAGGMEPLQSREDALFEALGKSKKRKKRKILITVAAIIAVLALVLVVGTSVLQRRVREQFASQGDEVLKHTVKTGTISTLVSGSGTLTNVDAEAIGIPEGVELTEILVENGDTVEENQLLALADMATVRSALSTLQDTIDDLDDSIYDADGDEASTRVAAGVPGRIKILYADVDDLVSDVMVENGALAVISLDGYMALDLQTDALSEGDSVTVTRATGEAITGTVDTVFNGVATILVTDDGPENAESVTVLAADGTELGSGELYVHSPLMVTGYAGAIRTVHVKLNSVVNKNSYIFTLKDTAFSANYDNLLRQRSDAEETLLELLTIQRYGGITAPVSGTVFSVTDLETLEDEESEVTDLLTLSPDVSMSVTISVDENDILSLELGQETNVTVSSVSEDTLTGIVTEIDKTASDGAYTAVVTLDKLEGMLPGMSASVDVKIQGVENAVLVPADAVHYTSTGAYVYTTYDEETQEYGGRVDIVVGLSNDDEVEVVSGLKEGDVVYYTEKEDFFFGGMSFGNMGSMPGGMPGGMGSSSGRNSGGNRSQGGMPSGMPSGGMPSGMPGGMGGRG